MWCSFAPFTVAIVARRLCGAGRAAPDPLRASMVFSARAAPCFCYIILSLYGVFFCFFPFHGCIGQPDRPGCGLRAAPVAVAGSIWLSPFHGCGSMRRFYNLFDSFGPLAWPAFSLGYRIGPINFGFTEKMSIYLCIFRLNRSLCGFFRLNLHISAKFVVRLR